MKKNSAVVEAPKKITPEQRLEVLKRGLMEEIEGLKEQLAKGANKLTTGSPVYELEWFDKYFTAGAHLSIANQVFMTVFVNPITEADDSHKIRLEWIVKQLNAAILNGAMYPSRSTSVCSNLVKSETLAAQADMVERLTGFLKYTFTTEA